MRDESMIRPIAAGLVVVGLFSVPAFTNLITQLSKRDAKQETYEDGDGKASPESVKAFSSKWPKAFILFFAAVGCATSIALAVLTTDAKGLFLENWLTAGASVSYPPL